WPAQAGRSIKRIRLENMASRGLSQLQFRVVDGGAGAEADDFLAFLATPAARAIAARYGLRAPDGS
ncbi:MAG: hypothetical protein AAF772_20645, partial [Acidobacteriota bacterium]